jgi:hypothetical protein
MRPLLDGMILILNKILLASVTFAIKLAIAQLVLPKPKSDGQPL